MRKHGCVVAAMAASLMTMPHGFVGVAGGATSTDGVAAEQARVEALCREAQAAAAELTGFPEGEPVPVSVRSRSEVRRYMLDFLDTEYPNDELERRSLCFGELGLLPRGYDLEAGLVAVLDEEAGGLYDPHSKVFLSIADLSDELKTEPYQRLIAAHELTHALQDRKCDLVARSLDVLDDLDGDYGFTAIVEGTAMVVGMAHMQDVSLDRLGDLGPALRSGYQAQIAAGAAFSSAPTYLQERLIGPYVDGSVFVQAYLKDHPDGTLASLFDNPPVSSEQAVHYDKYVEGDEPTVIDLGMFDTLRPESWRLVYTNTLGEFEIRTLCESHAQTRTQAARTAAGWDGFRIAAYETASGHTVLVGASWWDSEHDAVEFSEALGIIFRGIHGDGSYGIRSVGPRVGFVTGVADDAQRGVLLDVLAGEMEPGAGGTVQLRNGGSS